MRIDLSVTLKRKVVIFAPFYPLAPDYQLYDAAKAITAAWQYVSQHPAADKDRLVLVGESAGGGLACEVLCSIAKADSQCAKVDQAM